jgi:hypothetical protein
LVVSLAWSHARRWRPFVDTFERRKPLAFSVQVTFVVTHREVQPTGAMPLALANDVDAVTPWAASLAKGRALTARDMLLERLRETACDMDQFSVPEIE